MSKRIDCIKNNYTLPDGTVIVGHEYIPMIAAYDCDTDRTYIFDECERCSKRQVSWTHGKDKVAIEDYPQFVEVGGDV